MKKKIAELKSYAAKTDKTKDTKSKILKNINLPYGGIKKVIKSFEDGDFLIKYFGKKAEQPSGSEDKQECEKPSGSKNESEESDEYEESEK